MSAVHRLGDVVIGHKCEVDNCLLPAMAGQSRCYEHSEDRLIEDLFRGEECRFGGVNCTVQATACNEYDVPMCANCLSIHNRIRRGSVRYNGRNMRNDELREAMDRDMMNRMNASMQSLREQQPQSYLGDVVARGQYYGHGPSPFTPPAPGVHPTDIGYLTDEELCECNNLEHSQLNEECPLNNVGEVCWGHGGPCDNYSEHTIEYHEDDAILDYGPVPLCNNCYRAWLRERRGESPPNEDPPLPTIGHAIASGGLIGILGIPPMRRDEGEETE